jgi:hypothetical protein
MRPRAARLTLARYADSLFASDLASEKFTYQTLALYIQYLQEMLIRLPVSNIDQPAHLISAFDMARVMHAAAKAAPRSHSVRQLWRLARQVLPVYTPAPSPGISLNNAAPEPWNVSKPPATKPVKTEADAGEQQEQEEEAAADDEDNVLPGGDDDAADDDDATVSRAADAVVA